jgi:hypothetical protein
MNSEMVKRFVYRQNDNFSEMPFSAKGTERYEGRITWTMTTIGYIKYTLNLVTWLQRIGVPWKLCIICCDAESELFFRRQQIPCVFYKKRTIGGMAAYGTPSFSTFNMYKIELLKWFSEYYDETGYDKSLYIDGDIVIQKDPWPLLDEVLVGEETLAFQCDCEVEDEHFNCRTICSGVIATRHVSKDQGKIYEFDKDRWDRSCSMDQGFIARGLELYSVPFKILDRRQFGNGTWLRGGQWRDGNWTLLHYNFLVSGVKRAEMKRNEHWLINY